MASEEVDILVTGTDATGSAFSSAEKGLSRIEKAAGTDGGKGVAGAFAGIGAAATAAATLAAAAFGTVVASLFSVSDQAALVREQLHGLDDVNMDSLLRDASLLSSRYGVDTQETIGATRALMTEFGLSSEEATNLLISGFEKGLNSSGDFLETIGEYSNQFSEHGATAEQFFSVLATGMGSGVLGTDKAADAFKEFGIRIQDGSASSNAALRSLFGGFIDNSDAISSSTKRVTELEEKLRKLRAAKTQDPEAIAAATAELEAQRSILAGLQAQQGQFTRGSLEFAGGWTELMRQLSAGELSVADAMPMVQQALSNIEDPLERNRLGVALFGTQWEDLGATAVLGIDMASTSLGDLSTTADEGRNRIASLGELGPRVWGEFTTSMLPASEALLSFANEYLPSLLDGVRAVAGWVTQVGEGFGVLIAGFTSGSTEGGLFTGALNTLNPVLETAGGWVQSIGDWLQDRLLPSVSSAGQGFSTMLQPHLAWLSDFTAGTLMPALENLGQFIGDNLPGAIDVVAPILTGTLNLALTSLELLLTAVAEVWTNVLSPAFSDMGRGLEVLGSSWSDFIRGIQVVRDELDQIGQAFGRLAGLKLSLPELKLPEMRLPGFAEGVTNFRGGYAVVGEQGPELVHLPRGSNVIPAPATRQLLAAPSPTGGGASLTLTIAPVFNGTVIDNAQRLEALATAIVARARELVQQDFTNGVDQLIRSGGLA